MVGRAASRELLSKVIGKAPDDSKTNSRDEQARLWSYLEDMTGCGFYARNYGPGPRLVSSSSL